MIIKPVSIAFWRQQTNVLAGLHFEHVHYESYEAYENSVL